LAQGLFLVPIDEAQAVLPPGYTAAPAASTPVALVPGVGSFDLAVLSCGSTENLTTFAWLDVAATPPPGIPPLAQSLNAVLLGSVHASNGTKALFDHWQLGPTLASTRMSATPPGQGPGSATLEAAGVQFSGHPADDPLGAGLPLTQRFFGVVAGQTMAAFDLDFPAGSAVAGGPATLVGTAFLGTALPLMPAGYASMTILPRVHLAVALLEDLTSAPIATDAPA
jgi:hypothetical protein